MVSLAWKIKELSELNEQGRSLNSAIGILATKLTGECRWIEDNIRSKLKEIRVQLAVFVKGVTRHQRTPATHVLVFMISNEERDKKPYALPVQCVPYKGVSDSMVRQLANKIIHEMSARKMNVAGICSLPINMNVYNDSCRLHYRWRMEFPSNKREYETIVYFSDPQ